ncbi:PREDICTED: ribonuclease P protein subunit p21 [Myotis brandtii]|uniref:ribonuclease P protein subunit p21 n=1 Tax=Myotis brandtii TaxID=109478 RepID=UPI00070424AE|nr:PREDICTED: ribonuclease P protein subunit p21 [Myotis brandtii]
MAGQVKDREAFQRLSFLYQLTGEGEGGGGKLPPLPPAPRPGARDLGRCPDPEADPRPFVPEPPDLTIRGRGQRPDGSGCKGQRWTVQTCLTCQRSQRFLNDPAHVLWGDLPEAQLGSQSDPKPPQPLPSTARPTPTHLTEEKVQPQSSRHQ